MQPVCERFTRGAAEGVEGAVLPCPTGARVYGADADCCLPRHVSLIADLKLLAFFRSMKPFSLIKGEFDTERLILIILNLEFSSRRGAITFPNIIFSC